MAPAVRYAWRMPLLHTRYSGAIPYQEDAVFEFPLGLPAFENEKRFALLELRERAPLVFLQSLTRCDLCFLAFPVWAVEQNYRLAVSAPDLETLGLEPRRQPRIGSEVLVLALLCVRDEGPVTANLMAPIVANIGARRAVQAIRDDRAYSHEHPVETLEAARPHTPEEAPACWS